MPQRPVLVGTTAVRVVPYHADRKSLLLLNAGTSRVWISENPADPSLDGFGMDAGVTLSYTIADGDEPWLALFGVSVSGVNDVRVIEGYGLSGIERSNA